MQIIELMFLTVLDYSDIIYMNVDATSLKPLDAVCHNTLRFITGVQHSILYQEVGLASLMSHMLIHCYDFIY
jgi:hypothetical protein